MKLRLVAAALLAATAGGAMADIFDFSYRIEGGDPRGLSVVQVFDNGKRTWIQLRQPEPLPVFLSVTSAGQAMLVPKREGQLLVIEGVERVLEMVLAGTRVRATYTGHMVRTEPPVLFGAAEPVRVDAPLPTPVPAGQLLESRRIAQVPQEPKASAEPVPTTTAGIPFARAKTTLGPIGRRRLAELLPKIQASASITLVSKAVGADLGAAKARYQEVVNSLVKSGIPREKLQNWEPGLNAVSDENGWVDFQFVFQGDAPKAPPVVAAVPVSVKGEGAMSPGGGQAAAITPAKAIWNVKPEDRVISKTISRWAREAGWLVFWEAPDDFEAVPAEFTGSFRDAVTRLVIAYSTSDSPIRAHFSDDGRNRSVLIEKYKGNSSNSTRGGDHE